MSTIGSNSSNRPPGTYSSIPGTESREAPVNSSIGRPRGWRVADHAESGELKGSYQRYRDWEPPVIDVDPWVSPLESALPGPPADSAFAPPTG